MTGHTISDVAERFGVATHVLRHWESEGLLTPDRLPNGRRSYRREHLVAVAAVVRAKAAGLSLAAVRELLGAPGELLAARRRELRRELESVRTRLELVEHALDCTAERIVDCPHFQRVVGLPLTEELTGE
ncbi:MerR family transcriptional regulator [Streptomyces sp. NPDC001941]|uniref:MerR family transcriptional regulator n=1 Tax=Streptomyces sp. NPDC001941 TaxID=3154659 RepID=UPI003321596D